MSISEQLLLSMYQTRKWANTMRQTRAFRGMSADARVTQAMQRDPYHETLSYDRQPILRCNTNIALTLLNLTQCVTFLVNRPINRSLETKNQIRIWNVTVWLNHRNVHPCAPQNCWENKYLMSLVSQKCVLLLPAVYPWYNNSFHRMQVAWHDRHQMATGLRIHFSDCGTLGKQTIDVNSSDIMVTFRSGRTSITQRGFIAQVFGNSIHSTELNFEYEKLCQRFHDFICVEQRKNLCQ